MLEVRYMFISFWLEGQLRFECVGVVCCLFVVLCVFIRGCMYILMVVCGGFEV